MHLHLLGWGLTFPLSRLHYSRQNHGRKLLNVVDELVIYGDETMGCQVFVPCIFGGCIVVPHDSMTIGHMIAQQDCNLPVVASANLKVDFARNTRSHVEVDRAIFRKAPDIPTRVGWDSFCQGPEK